MYSPVIFNYNLFPGHHQLQSVRNIRGLQYIGASSCQKKKFFVLFSDMNHVELKVPSPFGRPSSDTQNLVLSELSLFIPPQNIENKILGLQYIGAGLQYIGAPKCS